METILLLKREDYTNFSTIGRLYVDNEYECYTLEDTVREEGVKIYGQTAIPTGRYEIAVSYSNRFKRLLPLVMGVPNFTGVRIHPGNRPEDTAGCILVGKEKGTDIVYESRNAFNSLFGKIETALRSRKVYLEIV